MSLDLSTRRAAAAIVFSCVGRIVFGEETTMLCKMVRDSFVQSSQIVLELANVNNVDSGGLGALVGLVLSARRVGGDVKLCGLPPKLRKLFRLTHLDSVIEVHADAESAIAAFSSRAAVA